MRLIPALLFSFTLLVTSFLIGGDRPTGKPFATRSEVIARHGMAATSQPLATQVAIDILKQGGNAIDAAIAANAVLGVVEPMMNGIGGDLFAIVWIDSDQRLYGLNASGRSPGSLTIDEFRRRGLDRIPMQGPLSLSVPGAVDGWFELHSRFGSLPMSTLLEPAIQYAEEGFPVSEIIAHDWAALTGPLMDKANFVSTFLIDGRAPETGEIVHNPGLASTLQKIAEGGREVFYGGEIAQVIESYCKKVGCFLTADDFASHESEWTDPVSTTFRGYEVWELPPNGQGIAVLQMLNLLEPFDLRRMGHNSGEYLHHLVEAKKIAFEDRARFYADPAFNQLPTEELISKEYADRRRSLLDTGKATRSLPPGNPQLSQGDTVYLTVADADRNMVSLIQSVFLGFGSGLVPDGLGFCLQNRGALFTLEEGHFNQYAPEKRPFQTIIPGFVTRDGVPFLSFGVMGGDMQPQGHLQVLLNIIEFGMNTQEAGDAARFYHDGSSSPTGAIMEDGGTVALESEIPFETHRDLVERGHRVNFLMGIYGGYQAILYDAERDLYRGASESRKDGQAAGY